MQIFSKQIPKNSSYRPELDGIRALAIISVIINHFNEKFLPGGFLGVDMFFVLSGFVVSASLYRLPTQDWRSFIFAFYARRIKRILPALVFCVIVSAFVGCFFIQLPEETIKAGIYALGGASNIYFYSHSSDYFGEDARHNLFTHTWSLGVEEQFYLMFPALLVLIGFRLKRRLSLFLFLASFASFMIWIRMSRMEPSFAFYMIFSRFWEIGLGCLTFLFTISSKSKVGGKLAVSCQSIALLTLLVCFLIPKDLLILSTTATCVAIAALIIFLKEQTVIFRFLSQKALVMVGILSYSLYLWHWPVIALSRHTVGISSITIVFQIGLMLLFSLVSYYLIESPIRHSRIIKSDKMVLLAGLSVALLSGLTLKQLNENSRHLFSANMPRFNLTRAVFEVFPNFEQCSVAYNFENTFPPKCYYANPNRTANTLWLVGDSTTWALKGMASKFSTDTHFNIAMFADDSVLPSTGAFGVSSQIGRGERSREFFVKTFSYIVEHSKKNDLVLITANLNQMFCHKPELFCENENGSILWWKDPSGNLISVDNAFNIFLSDMGDLHQKLLKKGAHLIVSAPLPRWEREHRIYCEHQWYRPSWENEKCNKPGFSEQIRSRSRIVSILNQAEEKYGYLVFDPFPFLCNEVSCGFSDPVTNENYWIDETHLSTSGGRRLAEDFRLYLSSKHLESR